MEFLTDPIANMERIHRSNFAYNMLLKIQGKEEKDLNSVDMSLNERSIPMIKSELNNLNLDILKK